MTSGWRARRAARRQFARDIAINVLANLAAGAVIYVLAVVGGYLQANGLVLSVVVLGGLLTGAWLALLAWDAVVDRLRLERKYWWGAGLIMLAAVVAGILIDFPPF